MFSDPPTTSVEDAELADIHPDARDVFYRTIKRRWYLQAAVGTFAGWAIEYAVLGFGEVIWYTLPLLLVALWVHRQKWNRETDYGALARAKLAENPHKSCAWQREAYWTDRHAEVRDENGKSDESYRESEVEAEVEI